MSEYIHSVGYPPTVCTYTYVPLCIYPCVYAGTRTAHPCTRACAHGRLRGGAYAGPVAV